MPQKLSPERYAQAETLLEDGASFCEVERTISMSRQTLAKYFPGKQWTKSMGGKLSAETRAAERSLGWRV